MDYINFYTSKWLSNELTLAIVIIFALILIALINAKSLSQLIAFLRMKKRLNGIGIKQKRNLVYFDELDGYFKIDRLILLKDAILAISLKKYAGNIYCAKHISDWTQMIGQKSYKFQNPLFDLDNQITTLQALIPEARIMGALFFDHNSSFPKGCPDNVLHPDNIPADYLSQKNSADINPQLLEAWNQLIKISNRVNVNHHPSKNKISSR